MQQAARRLQPAAAVDLRRVAAVGLANRGGLGEKKVPVRALRRAIGWLGSKTKSRDRLYCRSRESKPRQRETGLTSGFLVLSRLP